MYRAPTEELGKERTGVKTGHYEVPMTVDVEVLRVPSPGRLRMTPPGSGCFRRPAKIHDSVGTGCCW